MQSTLCKLVLSLVGRVCLLKNYNFIQFWCVPLLTPELYQNKISREAYQTDPEVRQNSMNIISR